MKELFFVCNITEDLRIDSNTQPHLKKYVDVVDNNAAANFNEALGNGDLTKDWDSLKLKLFRYLLNHKGLIADNAIIKIAPTLEDVFECTSIEAFGKTLDCFSNEIKSQIVSLYEEKCDCEDQEGDAGDCDDPSKSDGSGDSDESGNESGDSDESGGDFGDGGSLNDMLDGYVGDMVKDDVLNSLDKEAGIDKEDLDSNIPKEKFGEVRHEKSEGSFHKPSDEDEAGDYTTSGGEEAEDNSLNKTSQENMIDIITGTPGADIISSELNAQVKSFKDVQVHTSTETLKHNDKVTYDTVVYDATN